MRFYVTVIIILCIVFAPASEGGTIPAADLETLDGGVFNTGELAAQINLFNFWASWCGPCRMELPHLNDLYEKFKDRDAAFYAVNTERSSERMKRFLRNTEIKFTVLRDPAAALTRPMGIRALPSTYLIDKDGNIVFTQKGYRPGMEKEIEKIISRYLEKKDEKKKVEEAKESN